MSHYETATFTLGNARPRLREGIELELQEYAGSACYVAEDRVQGKCFRLGLGEAALLAMFDGRTTVTEALAETSRQLGAAALNEQQATQLCQWLVEQELVDAPSSHSAERLATEGEQRRRRQRLEWLNPLMVRIPLLNPDRWVAILAEGLGWVIAPWFAVVWTLLVLWGGSSLLVNWPQFAGTSARILDRSNWLWLSITWLSLKAAHELAHAVVCRRFGGPVRSCGVLLLMLAPLPFVDVTSSWRFVSKGQRLLTAAAGMLAEFLLAAIAAIVFVHAESPLVRQHAANVIVSASMVTLFFNLNPLMRFDGYYMLSDWLELPNLSTRGAAWVRGCWRWLFLGIRSTPAGVEHSRWIVPIYGVLSACWMLTVTCSLTIAALNLLPGVGLLFALLYLVLAFVKPATAGLLALVGHKSLRWHQKVRGLVVASLLLFGIWQVGERLPAPTRAAFPAIIEVEPLTTIRNSAAGFVDAVYVATGDEVEAGQALFALRNADLTTDLNAQRIQFEQSQLRQRGFLSAGEVAAAQMEAETALGLQKRIAELELLVAQLTVRAEGPGRVLSRHPEEWTGQHVRAGTELLLIARREDQELLAMVPANEVRYLTGLASPCEWRAWGHYDAPLVVQLRRIEPRASLQLPHPGLGAHRHGPLAVTPVAGSAGESSWQLLSPVCVAHLSLSEQTQAKLLPGERGEVVFRVNHGNLRQALVRWAREWIALRVQEWHGM